MIVGFERLIIVENCYAIESVVLSDIVFRFFLIKD